MGDVSGAMGQEKSVVSAGSHVSQADLALLTGQSHSGQLWMVLSGFGDALAMSG